MPDPFVNRKKVRGWKRRVRRLERWRDAHLALDVDALRRDERHYLKIGLDPWNRLTPREPPQWFRRRIVEALAAVLRSWDARLRATGEPYYLRLWLFHPRFHRSQVVAAMGEGIAWYRNTFGPAAAGAAPAPPREYDPHGRVLAGLRWEPRADEDHVFPRWAELSPREDEVLRRTAARVEETRAGGTCYVLARGGVWLGGVEEEG